MGSVFISYAHEDETKARKIKERLEEFGFSAWAFGTAPARRDDISTVIDAEIDRVACVLVLWSKSSRNSVWVRGEALRGLAASKYLGLLLDPLIPPVPFNALNAPDISDWSGLNEHLGWDALIRGLADLSEKPTEIIQRLESAQQGERIEGDRLTEAQPRLPLNEPEQELDAGPVQDDVDAIISAAQALLSQSTKLDVSASLAQATLDQEMLRDAAFVVSSSGNVPRPRHAKFDVVDSIAAAVKRASDGDLIVVHRGRYEECVRIDRNIRLVGLGAPSDRPVLVAKNDDSTLLLRSSARIENLAIETTLGGHAVQCDGGRPAILRCDIRRFAEGRVCQDNDAAFYVAGKANPIVIATSIAATACPALYFVRDAGGHFLGSSVLALRGDAINCRGRPQFQGCSIEAIGAHAVNALTNGSPSFASCEISGRGATVVRARNRAYPKIRESRVSAIRQLAFDFEDEASGHYEANIVSIEVGDEAGTGRKASDGFFARFKSKQDAVVAAASNDREFARLRGRGKPLFVANTTPEGEALREPASFGGF
jgi:hypothetical protein